MKNVNIKIEEMDAGNNKICYKQNSSGFWRGEFTINFSDYNEGKKLADKVLDDMINILNDKNKVAKNE